MDIILASKSPRRKEILESLGLQFRIITADADESSDIKDPEQLVMTLAERKGEATVARLVDTDTDNTLVIACDTLVCLDGEFLGKPRDAADARRMLRSLSGREHFVVSGLYLWFGGRVAHAAAKTKVIFESLSDAEIDGYIASGEPFDKAGAYAIQGRACVFVRSIDGDYLNVVGLPANLMYKTLKEELGIDLHNV